MPQTAFTKGKCLHCDKSFWYVRYRADKNYCSKECRNRYYYVNKGTYSDRSRRTKMSDEEFREWKREYDKEYRTRPEVRAKINARNRQRYNTDEYRAYARDRYWASVGGIRRAVPVLHGYTNHRWFNLVRKVVGDPPPENSVYFDTWADRMGEAILALLEGRSVEEAVREYNRKEYIPRNRTDFIGEWHDDEETFNRNIAQLGTSPSAEEEATKNLSLAPLRKTPYSHGKNRRRFGNGGSHHGKTAPTRRESFRDYQDRPGFRRS